MKALLDLFKQVQQDEQFDVIKIGIASPEKIRSWSVSYTHLTLPTNREV